MQHYSARPNYGPTITSDLPLTSLDVMASLAELRDAADDFFASTLVLPSMPELDSTLHPAVMPQSIAVLIVLIPRLTIAFLLAFTFIVLYS